MSCNTLAAAYMDLINRLFQEQCSLVVSNLYIFEWKLYEDRTSKQKEKRGQLRNPGKTPNVAVIMKKKTMGTDKCTLIVFY